VVIGTGGRIQWEQFKRTGNSTGRRKLRHAQFAGGARETGHLTQRTGSSSSTEAEYTSIDSEIAVSPAVSRTGSFTDSIRKVECFRALPEGWDSYGARRVTSGAIRCAAAVLEALDTDLSTAAGSRIEPFDIAPVPTGGIQLEWREKSRSIELEITPGGEMRYLLVDSATAPPRYEQVTGASWREVLSRLVELLNG